MILLENIVILKLKRGIRINVELKINKILWLLLGGYVMMDFQENLQFS